jgi:hypothetical protein
MKNDRHDVNHKLFFASTGTKKNICIREWLRVIYFHDMLSQKETDHICSTDRNNI